jgi:hypothetical protein
MAKELNTDVNIEPPLVLVKTWVSLIKSRESEEVKRVAVNRLVAAFGDMKTAAEYCARNDIKIK